MPRRLSPPLFAAAFFLVAGCGGAARPPASPPGAPATKVPVAPAVAAPAPSAAPAAPVVSATPDPPPLAEPLPPLARAFVSVTLPGVTRPVVAIGGRGPKDLWFVTSEEITGLAVSVGGEVLHYDGKRVKSYGHPCDAAVFRGGVVVAAETVVALGSRPWARGVHPLFRVALGKAGKWSCDYNDVGYREGLTRSSGDHVWQLSCYEGDCHLERAGGPAAAVPSYHLSFEKRKQEDRDAPPAVSALWMNGLDDGWMVHLDDEGRDWLLRYNGVTWVPQAPLEQGLLTMDLWADQEGHAWLLARRGGSDQDPANTLLRFDGHGLSKLPLPASFAATMVRGTGPRDVWLLGGGRKVYQWDGQQLRQGEAPFEVQDAWGAPGGEVWIVGGDENGPGVTAHTAALAAKGVK
jgi:hypothetical protein